MNRKWFLIACLGIALAGCGGAPRQRGDSSQAPELGAVTESKAGSPAPATASVAQRRIVRNGQVTVRVTNLSSSEKQALSLIKQMGGYVESQSTNDLTSPTGSIELSARIPVAKFDTILERIKEVGIISFKQLSAEDVTTQIADMGARLRVMRAQEEVYLNLLKQAKNLKDSLAVHDQLMQLRSNIESTDAQLKSTSDLADMSTLVIRIEGATQIIDDSKQAGWAQQAFNGSANALKGLGIGIAQLGISVAVLSPLWLPPVAGIWLWRRKKSRQRATPAP